MRNDGEQVYVIMKPALEGAGVTVLPLTRGFSRRTMMARRTALRTRSGPGRTAEKEISDDVGAQDVRHLDPNSFHTGGMS